MPAFSKIWGSLPRHQSIDDLRPILSHYKKSGMTGIWIENDYLRWSWEPDPDNGFGGNWRLFNIFDFTRSREAPRYRAYLHELGAACAEEGLELCGSFWLPKLNQELLENFKKHEPSSIGKAYYGVGHERESWCSCPEGTGIKTFQAIVTEFLVEFPEVSHLKVSIKDNSSFICTAECPHSHGATEAENAARVFAIVQHCIENTGRPPENLIVYPWFWEKDFEEAILDVLKPGYTILTKYAVDSKRAIEEDEPAGTFFDASLLATEPGPIISKWKNRLGGKRVIDMLPLANSMDSMFVAHPPIIHLVLDRLVLLAKLGIGGLLDFECAGSPAASTIEALGIFQSCGGELNRESIEKRVAVEFYGIEQSEALLEAWRLCAEAWDSIPMSLHVPEIIPPYGLSPRLGLAWPLCASSPIVREAFADNDQAHHIHWFSPYNFFNFQCSLRSRPFFIKMEGLFAQAQAWHQKVHPVKNQISFQQEARAIQGLRGCSQAAINFCNAALAIQDKNEKAYAQACAQHLETLKTMQKLNEKDPTFWANNCWHPHQTSISQRNLGFDLSTDRNAFEASLRIMKA